MTVAFSELFVLQTKIIILDLVNWANSVWKYYGYCSIKAATTLMACENDLNSLRKYKSYQHCANTTLLDNTQSIITNNSPLLLFSGVRGDLSVLVNQPCQP